MTKGLDGALANLARMVNLLGRQQKERGEREKKERRGRVSAIRSLASPPSLALVHSLKVDRDHVSFPFCDTCKHAIISNGREE